MSEPIRQHLVPKLYLKNFAFLKKGQHKVYTLDKKTQKIFEANIDDIAVEKHFYTVEKLENKYFWEQYYAEKIEPMMSATIQEIIKKSNLCVLQNHAYLLTDDLKSKLSFIIVFQMLRGQHTRKYEEVLFEELSPQILAKTKEKFREIWNETLDKKLKTFQSSKELFKLSVMEVSLNWDKISQYAETLFMRPWLLYKVIDDTEFVTSDEPVLIMDRYSLDITPFKNGIAQNSTVIFYPLSSKILIALYAPDMLFGELQNYDGTLTYIDGQKEQKFIQTINKKQLEHSYRQVYGCSKSAVEVLLPTFHF